jgi:hypothetical protein
VSNDVPIKLSQLRRIAFDCWDPIGIRTLRPETDDEYDGYMLHVARLFKAGAPVDKAARYLAGIETDHMGLSRNEGTAERAETTAMVVLAYLERLRAEPHKIELDASEWRSEDDLWGALLTALGAPDWHGHNYDALWETVTEAAHFGLGEGETINSVQPPFSVTVTNAGSMPSAVRGRLEGIAKLLQDAKLEYDMEVSLEMDVQSAHESEHDNLGEDNS